MILLNREMGKKIIYIQIIYDFLIKFFISELGLPYFLNYLTDVFTVLIFLCVYKSNQKYFINSRFKIMWIYILMYFVLCTLSSLFGFVPLFLYIWALRNSFRFLLFFIGCVTCLDLEDEEKIIKILLGLQGLNIVLTLYQYLIKGYENDFLGGVFGYGQGVNGGTNLFFCILLILVINRYLNKKEKLSNLFFVIVSTLSLAVLSEIKVYYLEFILIVVMAFVINKRSKKTMIFGLILIVTLFIGLNVLQRNDAVFYNMITSSEALYDYSRNAYGNSRIIGRVTGISQINERFFENNAFLKLFGFGFGNCESSSSIAIFNSRFSQLYDSYNYKFFAYSMVYLETGMVGLIFYLCFFVICAIHALKNRIIFKNPEICGIIVSVVAICIISTWYNYSMKIEYAYFVYLILAFGAIEVRSCRDVSEIYE